jgi:hypothetical protein
MLHLALCYGRTLLALFMSSTVVLHMRGAASHKSISAHALIIAKSSTFVGVRISPLSLMPRIPPWHRRAAKLMYTFVAPTFVD